MLSKKHGLLIKKSLILNFFQNQYDGKATYPIAPKPLIFQLQQEALKFHNNCVRRSCPKIDLETMFFELGKSKFLKRHFLSIGTFLRISSPLFLHLFEDSIFLSLEETMKNITLK